MRSKFSNPPKFLCFDMQQGIMTVFVVEWQILAIQIFSCIMALVVRPDMGILVLIMAGFGAWALSPLLMFREEENSKYLFPYIVWKTAALILQSFGNRNNHWK